jgi:hypothetical protein
MASGCLASLALCLPLNQLKLYGADVDRRDLGEFLKIRPARALVFVNLQSNIIDVEDSTVSSFEYLDAFWETWHFLEKVCCAIGMTRKMGTGISANFHISHILACTHIPFSQELLFSPQPRDVRSTIHRRL